MQCLSWTAITALACNLSNRKAVYNNNIIIVIIIIIIIVNI